MNYNNRILVWMCVAAVLLFVNVSDVAAQQPEAGGYLKYQQPVPQSSSWVSSLAYIVSLLATFAAVLAFAYFASRFLGHKLNKPLAATSSKVLMTLPLGANRGVYVVEVAGKYLILGVTEHSIQLLQEIDDVAEIIKIREQNTGQAGQDQFYNVFQKQLGALQQLSQKFPVVFNGSRRVQQDDDEKR